MIDKEYIYDHIGGIAAEDLVQYIKQGIVTEAELEDPNNTAGEYSSAKRDKVKVMLVNQEPADWKQACETDTVEAYQRYLDAYPDGQYREEARSRKRALEDQEPNDWRQACEANTAASYQKYLTTYPYGRYSQEARTRIANLMREPDPWALVDKNNVEALRNFISSYPNNPHIFEAQSLINRIVPPDSIDLQAMIRKIKNIQADKRVLNQNDAIFDLIEDSFKKNIVDPSRGVSKSEWVSAIEQDKNLLNASVIHRMYNYGFLNQQDFYNIGVDREFVQYMLEDIPPQRFAPPEPLTEISRRSTEIYFWGIPSSGKSCALGGILSVANNGKVVPHMEKDNLCQGYGYMSRLMLHFKGDGSVNALPEGTATTSTYEMGFDLTDHKGLIHPITCVDLAGELIRCMFKSDSGESMSDDELNTLDTLTNILVDNRTGNQKMHFFVVEYGADDRLYEGLPQRTYLEAAVEYIKHRDIFQKDTDAIFILVSKVDKAPGGMSRSEAAVQYLNDNYLGFVNGLKALCRRYEINGGDLEVLPFSLGEVCFQNYCRFQGAAAEQVVRKIVERSWGIKENKLSKFKSILKG